MKSVVKMKTKTTCSFMAEVNKQRPVGPVWPIIGLCYGFIGTQPHI